MWKCCKTSKYELFVFSEPCFPGNSFIVIVDIDNVWQKAAKTLQSKTFNTSVNYNML